MSSLIDSFPSSCYDDNFRRRYKLIKKKKNTKVEHNTTTALKKGCETDWEMILYSAGHGEVKEERTVE